MQRSRSQSRGTRLRPAMGSTRRSRSMSGRARAGGTATPRFSRSCRTWLTHIASIWAWSSGDGMARRPDLEIWPESGLGWTGSYTWGIKHSEE